MPFLFMSLIVWDIGTKKMKEQIIKFDSWPLTLTSVNPSLVWMFYFCIWLQNKGKFLVWSEYYNQFGIYQPSNVSLLEPQQNNLSNPEAHLEPCQISKIDCFGKIVNG